MIKAIVPVSGGKDSQCCLLLACNEFGAENVLGLFCDTQFEHPDTYAHIEKLKKLYKVEIITICAGSVEEKVRRYKLFPGMGGSRHCTKELKIIPTKKFLAEFAKENGPVEVWYGMRSEESSDREKRYAAVVSTETYPAHQVMPSQYPKYLYKLGVVFRLPILDWQEWQVFKFIKGYENPPISQRV